jgi:two-component system, OmpR family, sensor histidine kinase VicK
MLNNIHWHLPEMQISIPFQKMCIFTVVVTTPFPYFKVSTSNYCFLLSWSIVSYFYNYSCMQSKKPKPTKDTVPFANAPYVEFLIEMAERTDQAVFVFDVVSNQFLYLNPSFESIWEITREAIRANPNSLVDNIHPDDITFVTRTYKELVGGSAKQEVEFRIIRPDDSERSVYLSAFLIKSKENNIAIAGLTRDVTEDKKYSDTLKKFAGKKNSLLEILSHDLAGPLGTIQGLSGLLARRVEKKEDVELIKLIEETSKRGITLIREFVKQEFLESSQVEIIKVRIDLVAKIREIIEQYQLSQQSIAKTFHLEASQEKVYVEIDEVKFMQAINNLISNAIKFTYDGGEITTYIKEKKNSIVISIADNGIGIPEHLQEGLFEKFTKARRPGIKGEPSVGLGMSIIKTIVELHGGKIWFESKEDKGTTFYLEIPKE